MLLVGATASHPCASWGNDEALHAFFQTYLETTFNQRPTWATALGDHRFDDQLDDVSPATREEWTVHTRRTLEALPQRVAYETLTRTGQIDYEIFEHALRRSLWMAEHTHPFEEDPRVYGRLLGGAVYPLLSQSTLPRETNITHALARMKRMPLVLQSARESLDQPPRVVVETAIKQNRGAIRFFEENLFTLVGETPQQAALAAAAAEVVEALGAHQVFLEDELLPRATGDWRLGREQFARKLEWVLDAGLTADQVLEEALDEFVRVRREMAVLARQLWGRCLPGQVLPPDDEEGRRDLVARVLAEVARDHGRPEDLVADITGMVDGVKSFIRAADLLRLPDPDRCRIIEMPEFQRGNATAYMNSPPPLDPEAIGHYAVSPPPKDWDAERVRSYLEEYNRHMLQILTIHEAYPGHYVQFEYANRHPSLIRKVFGSGVYVEGWAVYTEQCLLDQGYGDGDLKLRLTQLKFYLRAVANAILDYRMHCDAWSDEEALRFLIREAFQSEGEARLKVIRSKQSSTQLSTYFVGRMAHYRLRQAVQREMGDRFDLAAYHEAVLAQGPVPVKYLPELVRRRLEQPR